MKTKAVVYNENGAPLDVAKIEIIDLGNPDQDEAIVVGHLANTSK